MFDYALWVLLHISCLLLILLASAGAGHLFLHKTAFRSWVERVSFTLALGMGLWALLLFCLGLIGILYRQVILVSTVLGAAGMVFFLARKFKRKKTFTISEKLRELRTGRGPLLVLLSLIGLAYWALLIWTTQYPSLEWDGNSHQLVLSRYFLEDHRVALHKGVPYPIQLALNNMLFTWALAVQDDILAQMIEHTFLALIIMGLYSWGKRQNRPAFGIAAAASFLTHPLILWLSESAYVDLGITCYVFLSVYALQIFWDTRENSWWYLSMVLAGMAAGVKLPGLFVLCMVAAIGFWRHLSACVKKQTEPRIVFPVLLRGWVLGLLIAVPWYAFIAFHTGNPFWPKFERISQNIWASPKVIADDYVSTVGVRQRVFRHFLTLPIDWVYYPQIFQAKFATLSHLIIAWPLAWIVSFWNRSVLWWTLGALVYTVFWFVGTHDLRYWLPALPLATLALCESLRWIVERVIKSNAVRNGIWILLALTCVLWSGRMIEKKIRIFGRPPINADERKEFLKNRGQGYDAVAFINKNANEKEAIYIINASWLNYHLTPRVIDWVSFMQQSNRPTFRWPEDEQWVRTLESQNVKWILINLAKIQLPLPEFAQTQNPILNPFWPNYEFVYAESTIYVFRQKPIGTRVNNPRFVRHRIPPAYEGYHDVANCNTILGWAWNRNQPNEPVELELYDGELFLGTITADLFRRDLLENKVGNGKHGFVYVVPLFLKDGKQHRIRLKFAGTNIDMANTGKEIQCK